MWLVLVVVSAHAPAIEPERPLVDCVVRTWSVKEGLPSGYVQAIALTPEGDLWAATSQGLVRLDGLERQVFNRRNTRGLDADEIRHLVHDGKTMWARAFGGAVFRVADGALQFVARSQNSLAPWRGADGEVKALVLDGTGGELPPPLRWAFGEAPESEHGYGDFQEDASGNVWAEAVGKLWRRAPGGRFQLVEGLAGRPISDAGLLTHDGAGGLWITTYKTLFHVRGGDERVVDAPFPEVRWGNPHVDRHHCLWVAMGTGVARRCGDRWERFQRADGLLGEHVSQVLESPDGAVWISTVDGGLTRLSSGAFQVLGPARGVASNEVQTFLPDPAGNMLVGSRLGVDELDAGDRVVRHWGREAGLTDVRISAFVRLPDGGRLVGTREGGLYRLDGDRALPIGPPGTEKTWVFSAWVDSSGVLWSAFPTGTFRREGESWRRVLPEDVIAHAYVEDAGTIWAATRTGVRRYDPVRNELVLAETPRPSVRPGTQPIYMSAVRDHAGRLWFGAYQMGTVLRDTDGRFHDLRAGAALPEDGSEGLLVDRVGRVWMTGTGTVHSAERADVDAFLRGAVPRMRWRTYGAADGLPEVELRGGTGLNAVSGADGRLWFASHRGALVVDPAKIEAWPTPKAYLTEVTLGGQARPAGTALEIPPGGALLELGWSARFMPEPERITFRHRLRGHDSAWLNVGHRRRADFAGMRPGTYRFEVQASLDGWDWGPSAALDVVAAAHWWERPISWGIGGMLAALSVAAGARVRLARARRRAADLERQVSERSAALVEERAGKERAEAELVRKRELQALVEFGNRVAGQLEPEAVLDELESALAARYGGGVSLVLALREGRATAVRSAEPLAAESRLALEAALKDGRLSTARRLGAGPAVELADPADPAEAVLARAGFAILAPLKSGTTDFGLVAAKLPPGDAGRAEAELAHLAGLAAATSAALEGAWQAQEATRWKRVSEARMEWLQLDPVARIVFAAVARLGDGAGVDSPSVERAVLDAMGASDQGQNIARAVDALVERDILGRRDGLLTIARPSWLLLPELRVPLTELARESMVRVGAYRLVERIGAGGMGEVWRAVNAHDGSLAAVKLLYPHDSAQPEARRRLEREGEVVARIHHPNVVRLLERGEHEGRLYLAMELLDGDPLSDRLRAGPLPPDDVVDAAGQVLAALAELHRRGVAHRDVKPANIFSCRSGRYVLLDFGLARGLEHSTLTRAQQVLGTLPYMAPEQLRGEEATPRSDLWSLGVLVHEMATGSLPWPGVDTVRIAMAILTTEAAQIEFAGPIDGRVRALASVLLQRDPARRPASAAEALEAWRVEMGGTDRAQ